MKEYFKMIKVYDFDDTFEGFCVEVHIDESATEFYLCHKNHSVKMLMFGVPTKGIKYEFELLELIMNNIKDDIDIYQDVYIG